MEQISCYWVRWMDFMGSYWNVMDCLMVCWTCNKNYFLKNYLLQERLLVTLHRLSLGYEKSSTTKFQIAVRCVSWSQVVHLHNESAIYHTNCGSVYTRKLEMSNRLTALVWLGMLTEFYFLLPWLDNLIQERVAVYHSEGPLFRRVGYLEQHGGPLE